MNRDELREALYASQYTPTMTGDVRHYFNQAVRDLGVDGYAAFDRSLAAHDAQVRADEREKIAVAIEANLDQMLLTRGRGLAGGFARGLNKAARIARSGGAS